MKSKARSIRHQKVREINSKPFSGERSPYWEWVRQFGQMSPDGNYLEFASANPDVLPDGEPQTTPDQNSRGLMLQAIKRAKLSKGEKKVLKHLGMQGMTEEETADALGISRRSVRVTFGRAQKKILKVFVAISRDSRGIDRGDYEE